ncbi:MULTISPECIES: hypothetical protein [unclassified Kribbella]|uniref:hypothetical protein n=1 Tax=unclassified Kribbella TaxID=2644121 RepID=UPI00301680F6
MSETDSRGRQKRTGPRPRWHRAIGIVLLVVGLAIVGLNLAMEFGAPKLLPFGHSLMSLGLGIAVAVSSAWPFGRMDR